MSTPHLGKIINGAMNGIIVTNERKQNIKKIDIDKNYCHNNIWMLK